MRQIPRFRLVRGRVVGFLGCLAEVDDAASRSQESSAASYQPGATDGVVRGSEGAVGQERLISFE